MIRARTSSSSDTREFAAALSSCVRPRDLMVLVGEIGAGKTTFAQGFGAGLGVDEPITSPTFVLMRTYGARLPFHHVDIYRLDHLQEVIDIGLVELLDEGGVALMEWGDLADPVLPRDYLEIHLELGSEDEVREVELRPIGPDWVGREGELVERLGKWTVKP
jgi:tRNA threonylcarbamoyladenosine biosynthesis protein TsaE